MKNTVKYKVISQVAKKKTFTRRDLQKFIWVAQGLDIKNFTNRQGYYGTNIKGWVSDEIIDRVDRGVYKITSHGKRFLKDPKIFYIHNRYKRAEREADNLRYRDRYMWNKVHKLEGKLKQIRKIIEQ
tara:strand:- start:260 stop:640 length:381 start_codon:yes stop_codon:yes gene_type:complete